MPIAFERARAREVTLAQLVADFTPADLARESEDSLAAIEEMLEWASDADIVFVPEDPEASDPDAADPAEIAMPWTLGHLIVHVTASAEENAALGAEMARGVPMHGRSRWEVPWRAVTTVEQCRQRLAESRRIRLASLQMWPDAPPAEVDSSPGVPSWLMAKDRFARGLSHEHGHLEQMRAVLAQARAARGAL